MEIVNYEYYNTFEYPIEYKGLNFYHVKVEKYFEFHHTITCLQLDQFNDEDINEDLSILGMSYLDYLFYFDKKHPELFVVDSLLVLLGICLRMDFSKEENTIFIYQDNKSHIVMKINDILINYKDFNKIREIICAQNDIDMKIFDVDPQVRKKLLETLELQSKQNKSEVCSLEDQIICVMMDTKYTVEEIEKLSIRKFKKVLERADHTMHYKIYKTASTSGFVSFKEEYPHWLAKIDKNDIYSNVSSYEETAKKIGTKPS